MTPKRTIDIVLALSGILLLAPLLIICFAAISDKSSVGADFRPIGVAISRSAGSSAPAYQQIGLSLKIVQIDLAEALWISAAMPTESGVAT